MPDLVWRAASYHPESVALSFGNAQLTYGELIERAGRLARRLTAEGVAREVSVGICLERSFDYVIAALATMRAGGAYLPLDPRWPEARLRFVLDDARVPVVVTAPGRRNVLTAPGRTVLLADDAPQGDVAGGTSPSTAVAPTDLAYIICTSGSSGEPKGVEITHGNLLNLLSWHWEAFGVTAADRATFVAGVAFDAAVWEIWPYLTAGASVFLADDTTRSSSEALRAWLIEKKITHAFVPTPLVEPMIANPWPAETALRFLMTGGDTLHVRPADALPFSLVNNYGPTECTVVATSGIVTPSTDTGHLPAVGRPITGVDVHILDGNGEPTSTGGIGEIYIGGASVGRGYRNRSELTAERFVADRFRTAGDGARLYRTGDLGCWLPDGQIAFHGRGDNQVKIRGNRVELEEISAVLSRHPSVAQSATILHNGSREAQLIAYVVPKPKKALDAHELRDFLSLRLPEYMLPSGFVSLESLPLTPSGKLDRAALPAPSDDNMLSDAPYREPASVLESGLIAIVAELLGRKRIGVEDNFFLLGGHSLLGTQLVLKARQAFDVELTLRDLFQAQTIAKLAAKIEQRIVERLDRMSEEEASRILVS